MDFQGGPYMPSWVSLEERHADQKTQSGEGNVTMETELETCGHKSKDVYSPWKLQAPEKSFFPTTSVRT